MGATAIVSRMTGARRYADANYAANQAAVLGLIAGFLSALLMYGTADFLVSEVLSLSEYAREVALRYMYTGCWVAVFSGVVFALNAALRGAGDTRTDSNSHRNNNHSNHSYHLRQHSPPLHAAQTL